MTAVAAVAIGMVAADQLRIAFANLVQVGLVVQARVTPSAWRSLAVKRSTARRRASGRKRAEMASSGSAKSRPGRSVVGSGMSECPASPAPIRQSATAPPQSPPGSSLRRNYTWHYAGGHARGTASASVLGRRSRTASAARGTRPARGSREPNSVGDIRDPAVEFGRLHAAALLRSGQSRASVSPMVSSAHCPASVRRRHLTRSIASSPSCGQSTRD